jgi:hypothetical protein
MVRFEGRKGSLKSYRGSPLPALAKEITVNTDLLKELAEERDRQDERFPAQHLPDGTSNDLWGGDEVAAKAVVNNRARHGGLTWQMVLYEEVCEAFAEEDRNALRGELVQVAAVALRWIEDLDVN